MNGQKNLRLEQLTGLRYVAALLVFFFHLDLKKSNEIVQTIFSNGYLGVSFFFVLSGFVLSYSYQKKIVEGSLSLKKYILLRLARLTPLHFATTLPFVILAIYHSDLNLLFLITNLSYLHSWIPNSEVYFSFNAPSWSLSNEMFFYFCFFFLTVLMLKKLVIMTIFLIIFISIFALFVGIFLSDFQIFEKTSLSHWLFYIFPGFRILEFIVGIILFRLWKNGFRLNELFVIPAYLILFFSMYHANLVMETFRVSLFFLPVISFFLYVHLTEKTYVKNFFSQRFLILLGNSSFAFYLIHYPIINLLKKFLYKYNISDLIFFSISLILISFLSILTYLVYEKWAENKLKDYVKNFN